MVASFHILPSLVKSAQNLARPSISKYHVRTVGLGSTGRIFLSANLEFPHLPINQSVHAEQFFVAKLAINGEPQLKYLDVSATPCGHCRQFLQEIRYAPNIQLLITSAENEEEGDEDLGQSDKSKFKPLSQFLPHRFGPYDILEKKVPDTRYTRSIFFITDKSPKKEHHLVIFKSNFYFIFPTGHSIRNLGMAKQLKQIGAFV